MSFLQPIFLHAPMVGNLEQEENHDEVPSMSQPSKKMKMAKKNDVNAAMVSYITKLAEKDSDTSATNYEDEDLHFFKSLLPDTKQLSGSNKRKFKLEVMGLLNRALDRQNEASTIQRDSVEYADPSDLSSETTNDDYPFVNFVQKF